MSNKKGIRLLALVMAVVCTLTAVSATILYDRNGDSKTTVWDLQALFQASSKDYDAAVEQALGGKDELSPVSAGVYEIYTELGLRNMAKNANKGYTFNLMANIDLGGKNWTPVVDFKGVFNGNDKTISNLTITKSSGEYMGFFANTVNKDNEDDRTQIINLNMEGVNIIVDDGDAVHNDGVRYVGAIVGSNCGYVEACTAVSVVTDMRTTLAKTAYYGTLVGRNANYKPDGVTEAGLGKIVNCENALNVDVNITEESSFTDAVITNTEYQGSKTVNSKMATFFGELTEDSAGRKTGIAGFSRPDGLDTSLRWQDITNSTDLAHENLQQRRERAAAQMYKMCTVEWTQANNMTFYNYEEGTDAAGNPILVQNRYSYFEAGTVRKGLPYSMGSTNLDCFNAYIGHYTEGTEDPWPGVSYKISAKTDAIFADFMNNLNAAYEVYIDPNTSEEERNRLVESYPQLPLMSSTVSRGSVVGFAQYLGTHCASQVAWAWREVSAADGAGSVVMPDGCTQMIPSYGSPDNKPIISNNIEEHGIVPVNGLILPFAGDLDNNGTAYETIDKSILFSDFYVESRTRLWEALAKVTKGDALIHFSFNGGHVVLALSDAVVIRDYDGNIDTKLSYIVTAEQGGDPKGVDSDGVCHYSEYNIPGDKDSGYKWRSDCCVDRRTTFDDLTENTFSKTDTEKTGRDIYHVWIPTSCDVLKNPDSAGATAWCEKENGTIKSNFAIISYTVDGKTLYTGTQHIRFLRADMDITQEELTAAFGDMTGKTVTVKLANDQTFNIPY